jgi:hypothetical protein
VDVGTVSPEAGRRFGGWRRELRAFVEIFAVAGLAVVQPALDTLRRNANDVFVPPQSSPLEILALLVMIVLAPPAVAWCVEVAVGLVFPAARRFAHAAVCGAFVGLLFFEVFTRGSDLSSGLVLALAFGFGLGGAALVAFVDVARMFLRFLAIAPVVFTVLFVTSGQISPLVISTSVDAPPSPPIRNPKRVVMIVFDELPTQSLLDGNGRIDPALFPSFAALAGDGTWYRNNTSVAPYTAVAVPAILTGDYPEDPKAVSTASVYPNNLFTLLDDEYSINAIENTEALNPSGDTVLDSGFRGLLSSSYDLWKRQITDKPLGPEITERMLSHGQQAARQFITSLRAQPDKHLDYLHLLLPHFPWHVLPDGRSYTNTTTTSGLLGDWSGGQELADLGRQRHILQLQDADRLLGQAMSKLKKLGVYDDSLIVVTADHGEGFTADNPIRKATPANYSEVMWVPLIMKAAGQSAGRIDDDVAHSIDVLPTIADELQVKIPWKIDGTSLLEDRPANGPRRFLEIDLPDASKAPSEAKYKRWDGDEGFRRVLEARAAQPGADSALRVYKNTSRYGDLVGQLAAPRVRPGGKLDGYLADPGKFATVDPKAANLPWTYLDGRVNGKGGQDIAIVVNGTVASLTRTYDDQIFGGAAYSAVLPPQLFRAGENDVRMYVVEGPIQAPTLTEVERLG